MSTLVQPAVAIRPRRSLAARIWAAYELGQSRKRLRELPDYMLADIGVSQGEARKEAERGFWGQAGWYR